MINPSNSSLAENLDSLDNPLRIKRKFSNMMNISKSMKQGILNKDLLNKKKSYATFQDNLLFEEEIAKELQFEVKRKKNNNKCNLNDFIYKIENDLQMLKIHKPDNNYDNLNNQNEILFENSMNCKGNNRVNTDFNNSEKCLDLGNYFQENKNKFYNNTNIIKNQISFPKEKSSIINNSKENSSIIHNKSLNKNDFILEDEGKFYGDDIYKYFNELNDGHLSFSKNELNKHSKYQNNTQIINNKEDFEEKNYNFSFNENFNEIDMIDFKNNLNNQNFYNSELIDLETINTSRNSNYDDLSLSFITEYSNKNVSGNIISNAIETEKLMMKLFDICNPALQPTEK